MINLTKTKRNISENISPLKKDDKQTNRQTDILLKRKEGCRWLILKLGMDYDEIFTNDLCVS